MTALTEDGSYEDLMPFLLAMQKDCHVRNTRGVQWEGKREREKRDRERERGREGVGKMYDFKPWLNML
jgi:hypothetical protein